MMTPAEIRRAEEEKRIAAPLNDAWKRGFDEGKRQQMEADCKLFCHWCKEGTPILEGSRPLRHVSEKRVPHYIMLCDAAAIRRGADTEKEKL